MNILCNILFIFGLKIDKLYDNNEIWIKSFPSQWTNIFYSYICAEVLLLEVVTRDCRWQDWNDDMKSQKNLIGNIIYAFVILASSDVSGIMKIWNTGFWWNGIVSTAGRRWDELYLQWTGYNEKELPLFTVWELLKIMI